MSVQGSGPPVSDAQIVEMLGLHGTGIPSLDDVPASTHWPSLPPEKAKSEWKDLREWVEQLQERFAHLDHHAIPPCWWRHNEHVEALLALRDHERVSYSQVAPATAPVEWIRAFRDIEALLRSWTAEFACGSSHQEALGRLRKADYAGWEEHVADDLHRRGDRQAKRYS
jgi:hypothetical protein